MTTKSTYSRSTASPRSAARAQKRGKVAGQVTTTEVKHSSVTTSGKGVDAFVDSPEVKSAIANAVRREVARQLRVIGATPAEIRRDGDTPRAVRAYAREVFGSAVKADRWLRRPSVCLGGESPVAWLQSSGDPAGVYGALDAIAHGTPV
ncbi:MbcA/ParS/Xre antitoxin family protein [Burkholderia vietnamiensis]|uniref:MbcA/ParS/Xre antitoxin family protein n=1 Tax=Burkholderia vietnamiensis TaxID=60552 RepID=UPI001593FE74|nr:MbcA/ParS/Xre antitoxin family protein [Burkholderia vietnamiensis]MBR8192679.1 DUF2384 domain-containing protein [Burkholderia vietnamiensis]MCA8073515.1 MbcA/ParS/Xre antitoxin family protein [Burkholderia vietnamiensis]MCA8231719.1 MbcA/ParS/Xre antitoxin family protein [Burkholderia vietnamiensis]HDR8993176.1 DUF2384 domain-containing protein [Burkholderia vietnamiensis]HDR9060048.1 DUF2384 domain-containing protein [Burkholderia vietnamiensis]